LQYSTSTAPKLLRFIGGGACPNSWQAAPPASFIPISIAPYLRHIYTNNNAPNKHLKHSFTKKYTFKSAQKKPLNTGNLKISLCSI
jgi:hypothetical protein